MSRTPRAANRRRVRKQGRDVVLIRTPSANRVAGQPWRGKVAPGEPDRLPVRAMFKDFANSEVDGERVQQTDQRCLIAPKDLGDVKPTTADRIEDDGTVFVVLRVRDYRPGKRSFRYELQLRA
ncbi:MAG: hypothetical protein ACR2P3_00790 [Geminicoccaceae bacterium]